ncbi:hypothetical protein QO206_12755 [Leeuwenhoekiella aequorea]
MATTVIKSNSYCTFDFGLQLAFRTMTSLTTAVYDAKSVLITTCKTN